jgi:formate hydrogenlyase subunit 3/multisubunit Na+/H+ antiporter MnhD subunit
LIDVIMFPVPVLMLAGPLLLAFILFLVRRWSQAAAGAGVVAALLLRLLIAYVPLSPEAVPASLPARYFSGDTWYVMGRPLLMDEAIRSLFLLLLGFLALLYLLSLLWPQGSGFVPASMALLSPLAAALMIRPFAFGALFLLVAAALLAWLIQAGRAGTTQAALRCLLMAALAVPLLLVAGWMLEAEATAMSVAVARLMALAFVILLAGFPFHIWVAATLAEASPLTATVVFGLGHLAILFFILNLLQQWPSIGRDPAFTQWLWWSGALTIGMAAVLAYNAPTFGALLAYLLLADIGASLILLALGGPAAAARLFSLLFLRMVSLVLAGTGLSLIHAREESTNFAVAQGAAWRSPLGVALYVYGGLSLAGLPLTPGFGGRWSVVARLSEEMAVSPANGWLIFLLLLVSASGTIGLMRCLKLLLAPPAAQTSSMPEQRAWPAGAAILVSGFLVALFPQVLLAPIFRLAALF